MDTRVAVRAGTVRVFKAQGYGYIGGDDGKRLFFHVKSRVHVFIDSKTDTGWRFGATRAIGRDPQVGERVYYEESSSQRGWQADVWGFSDERLDSAKPIS